jgi:hypothetical protein
MARTARTVQRADARALKRHLKRAIRRRTRRTLKALSTRRNAYTDRRAERQIERRRILAAGPTAPIRSLGGAAKPAPNLIGPAPTPVAKKTPRKPPAGTKKSATPAPGAGRGCKRCGGTGVIHLRRGGKYAGAKPCPHVVAQWKRARKNNATSKARRAET